MVSRLLTVLKGVVYYRSMTKSGALAVAGYNATVTSG